MSDRMCVLSYNYRKNIENVGKTDQIVYNNGGRHTSLSRWSCGSWWWAWCASWGSRTQSPPGGTSSTQRTYATSTRRHSRAVWRRRAEPPLCIYIYIYIYRVRTIVSVLTTFSIFYAIFMRHHRIITGHVVEGTYTTSTRRHSSFSAPQ